MIELRTPQDLQAVMKTPYSPSEQQWAAISAPLTPAVVIAGAGSGKTTLMAARVVYLVVTDAHGSSAINAISPTLKTRFFFISRTSFENFSRSRLDTGKTDCATLPL